LQANTNEKNGSFLGLVRQWHIASFFRWRAGGCQTTSDATVSLGHTADADHGQLPGKSVGAISTSRYLPFVHGPGAGTASDPHAPIFIAPAKLLSVKLLGFKFALYSDQQ